MINTDIVAGVRLGGNRQLPPLQKWSDLTYLAWQGLTADSLDARANLEHLFQYQVANHETMNNFRRAHQGGVLRNMQENPPDVSDIVYLRSLINLLTRTAVARMGVHAGRQLRRFQERSHCSKCVRYCLPSGFT